MSYENEKLMNLEDGQLLLKTLDEEIRYGKHEDLTAGNALFLLSDRGETDNEPYAFRKTGGSKNAYGREMLKKVVGGTIAWNQLVQNGNFENATGWSGEQSSQIVTVSNHKATITGTNNYYIAITRADEIKSIAGHKYLISADVSSTTGKGIIIPFGFSTNGSINFTNATSETRVNGIISAQNTATGKTNVRYSNTTSGTSEEVAGTVKNYVIFDLTQMFGSTIADAIYAMEQATAGAGVTWFRSLFPKSYYAYDAGTLMSVNAESHALTGFNQWDEEWEVGAYNTSGQKNTATNSIRTKNYIPVLPGTVYYRKSPNNIQPFYYDADKNFISYGLWGTNGTITTPDNACYMNFHVDPVYGTTYKNDICINLSDTAKNGTYEPYQLRSYPLANVELRGVPKWENGQLVFDGDEYTPDGTIKRRYGIVDLGTLTWNSWEQGGSLIFNASISGKLPTRTDPCVCTSYVYNAAIAGSWSNLLNGQITGQIDGTLIYIRDTAYADNTAFKEAMSGVMLVYELVTPTTETADPFRELEISNRNGTEEFTDRAEEAGTRDVAIPVGTETFYPVDVFALIDSLQAMILENISNS